MTGEHQPDELGLFKLRESSIVRLDGKRKGLVLRLSGISEKSAGRHLTIVLESHEAEGLFDSLKQDVQELRL